MINDVSDLDTAAKFARLAVNNRMNPEKAKFTWNAIIGAMCDAGRSGDALDLFDFFFNVSKMKLDMSTCNLIIKTYCDQGRLDDALVLYNHLRSSSEHGQYTPCPDHETYDLLTKAMVDAGMMDQALELLLRGRDELFNFLKPGMYMNLIRGFLEQGNLDMAYQLRDDCKTCSIRNRIIILNSVFVEHALKQGNVEEAMELYKTSLDNKDGFTANPAVGNAYLKVFLKYGKKTQAWSLFQYMLDNYDPCIGLGLLEDTLNLMVDGCLTLEGGGGFRDAVNVFTETKAKMGYSPPLEAYTNLITRMCQNGRLSEAESVFDDLLKERNRKPDAATYKALIHAYVESGRVEDALQTANRMIASNLHQLATMMY